MSPRAPCKIPSHTFYAADKYLLDEVKTTIDKATVCKILPNLKLHSDQIIKILNKICSKPPESNTLELTISDPNRPSKGTVDLAVQQYKDLHNAESNSLSKQSRESYVSKYPKAFSKKSKSLKTSRETSEYLGTSYEPSASSESSLSTVRYSRETISKRPRDDHKNEYPKCKSSQPEKISSEGSSKRSNADNDNELQQAKKTRIENSKCLEKSGNTSQGCLFDLMETDPKLIEMIEAGQPLPDSLVRVLESRAQAARQLQLTQIENELVNTAMDTVVTKTGSDAVQWLETYIDKLIEDSFELMKHFESSQEDRYWIKWEGTCAAVKILRDVCNSL